MKTSSKYFDSIRINPGGKKKKKQPGGDCGGRSVSGPAVTSRVATRPRPDAIAKVQYFNFCMDHVREYNKNYNYFSGLSRRRDLEVPEGIDDRQPAHMEDGDRAHRRTPAAAPVFSDLKSGSARSMRMRDPATGCAREAVPQ